METTSVYGSKTDEKILRSEIEEANQIWMNGVATKDTEAVASVYTEDATVMPPNVPAMIGREGAKNLVSGALNSGISAVKLTTIDVYGIDDIAVENGKYEMMAGDQIADEGKYLVGWKKVEGKWLIHKDIFNSNLPVANTSGTGQSFATDSEIV